MKKRTSPIIYTDRYRLQKALALQLRRFLLKEFKSKKIRLLIGCDREFARKFIEYQFRDGMRWDNYAHLWEFDHVVSLTLFENPADPDAWHIINTQPLLISDNKNKGQFGVEDILNARLKSEKLIQYKDVVGRLIEQHIRSTKNLRNVVDWSTF